MAYACCPRINLGLKVSLGYILSSRLVWAVQCERGKGRGGERETMRTKSQKAFVIKQGLMWTLFCAQ